MSALESLILGIIQGLTEFLPVSSSGHLELVKAIFGNDYGQNQSLLITLNLHAATSDFSCQTFTIFSTIIGMLKPPPNW